ncbi:MAG: ectonucleotide pyrophosphatase/phosphodiesterase [Bacteroidota bacterium]
MKLIRVGLLLMAMLASFGCNKGEPKTPDSYVILVSFDGFRWDYMDLYDTPNFEAMAGNGVKADRLIPSFPTKTFPNHFTLATGLYPDNHGIINNKFYAEDLNGIYKISDRSMVSNPDAYFGEPIWVTAEKQGVRSASYYWVGSEAPILGISPSYWKTYDESVPYPDRVEEVIRWLELPVGKRPGLITLYFDQPDGVGHRWGPEHDSTGAVVAYLDEILGSLRDEIARLEYADRVNLIVLSDHGMGPISPDKYVNLFEHISEKWTDRVLGGNPVYLIDPADGFEDSVSMTLDALEGVAAWQKDEIPERLHYGDSPRFPGIVVVADSLWSIGTKTKASKYTGGTHGYDNAFTDMHTIFLAEGPAFRKGYTAPAISNVEIYGIIAHILGLEPAQTDGHLDSVREIFSEK